MFSFRVDVDNDMRHAYLDIKSSHIEASFSPDCSLPDFENLDVTHAKGEIYFDEDANDDEGLVSLEWDEKNVYLSMIAYGSGDKGSLTNVIPKTDDSFQQALREWIEFEKAEALVTAAKKQIEKEVNEKKIEDARALKKRTTAKKQELESIRNAEITAEIAKKQKTQE